MRVWDRLPPTHEKGGLIRSMPQYHTFYVNSSAMCVGLDGRCYLNPDSTYHHEPYDGHVMRVQHHDNGFHVWLDPSYKYQRAVWARGLQVVRIYA